MMNVPGRVLIAPSGFKESLSAEQVADAIAAGVRRALPGVVVDRVPVVDGGEGEGAGERVLRDFVETVIPHDPHRDPEFVRGRDVDVVVPDAVA